MSDVWKSAPAKTMDDLLRNELGVNSHPGPESGTQAIGLTVGKILSNNPNRVGLTMINLSANTIYIGPENTTSSSEGIFLSANGGSLSFDWRTDMTLIPNQWFAVATGAASSLYILEVVTS